MPPRRALFALAALALCSASVRAEPSAEDQDACAPDVYRLCSAAIPNESAIVACLNARIPQLNPRCRAVIDPPKPAQRRHRRHGRSRPRAD